LSVEDSNLYNEDEVFLSTLILITLRQTNLHQHIHATRQYLSFTKRLDS